MRETVRPIVERLRSRWSRLLHGESGQGLVEYALIISIVSLGALVALGFLSGKINNIFSKAGNSLNNVTVAAGGSGGGGGGGDTTAPIVTFTGPSGNNVDPGAHFTGTCGKLAGDSGTVTLTVTRTSGPGSPSVFVNGASVTCTGSGSGSFDFNPSGDMDDFRNYTAVVTQSDGSGNIGTASVSFTTSR